MPNPFLGPTYSLQSRPASVQRSINLMPIPVEPGNERTAWVFKDVPGLVQVTTSLQAPISDSFEVDLHGINNAGLSQAVGVTVNGLNPSLTYQLSLPATGRVYAAYRVDVINNPGLYRHDLKVSSDGGLQAFGTLLQYASAALARSAFPGGTISGQSSYTFWILDDRLDDNDGGLSVLATSIP